MAKEPSTSAAEERHRLRAREWNAQNREKHYRSALQWKAANPERARILGQVAVSRYRARQAGVVGQHSADQRVARWDFYAGTCWICGEPAATMDHVLPMSKGGPDWASNLRPACAPCNTRKRDRHPTEVTHG